MTSECNDLWTYAKRFFVCISKCVGKHIKTRFLDANRHYKPKFKILCIIHSKGFNFARVHDVLVIKNNIYECLEFFHILFNNTSILGQVVQSIKN